jgi:hypothetical protein
MDTQCCFINSATCGIGAEIATTPLDTSSQLAAKACKPEAVTKPLRLSNKLLTVVPAARQIEVETAASLPIITVVYTIGGPVVYQRLSNQLA